MAATRMGSPNLWRTYTAGGATTKSNHLNTFKLDSTYHWRNKYTATGAIFATTGNSDPLLYAPAAVTGSNNGRPNSSGYIAQFAYWPVQNIDLNINYTGYFKFNGARHQLRRRKPQCVRQQHRLPGLVGEFLGVRHGTADNVNEIRHG